MGIRWCPPLPTIGRAGPRIVVEQSSTLLQRLEEYYGEFRSVPDIFERRVSPEHQERSLRRRREARYLSDLTPAEQQSVLLRNLYFKLSNASRTKLRRQLDAGCLNHVRSWFHAANAAVLPLLISAEVDPPYYEVDVLVNWVLENCAHNYALFNQDWKKLKKSMRKSFALRGDFSLVETKATMLPYLSSAKRAAERVTLDGPTAWGRFVLLWTQTRATGMADAVMIRQSLEKFKSTVSDPGVSVRLNPVILEKVCRPCIRANGNLAKVSVGTTACLESSRAKGGKTSYLRTLASHNTVTAEYDFRTLERTDVKPRPVRSAQDLVHWATHVLLTRPTYSACVRVHAVSEPSKARTITVAPYAYQVIMGVFAHIFQPTLTGRQIRSGLKADRHLWRFLSRVLNPQNVAWEDLIDNQVHALSTDLSEATDWGNKSVASQVWTTLIRAANCPEFPLGLAMLAKTRYCGKRYCFVPDGAGNYSLTIAARGWLMGDMMTKVILTLSHQYCCELSGLRTYTLVGDDEIALDSDPEKLRFHITESLPQIFKVSEDDTYVSNFFAFYCEEGTILPQSAKESVHVQMKRGEELYYLDYPRLRLLLPQIIETDAYSMTNIGRFALLGKEQRWVSSTNTHAESYFIRASLLQHMLVPQDADTLCPYTPIEIGGDGAMPHSAKFLAKVVDDKCRNPRETKFRLRALLNNKFSHKFVRSDRLDKVVNKHHLYLPKIEKMRELLPEDSIVVPQNENAKVLLQSVRIDHLADPQTLFFELAKGCYYAALLAGKEPPEPVFSIDREFSGGHTVDPTLDYQMFIDTWKNPGFKFQNSWGYWVDKTKIPKLNPMNLGWDWDKTKYPSSREILDLWVKENVDFEEQALPDILNTIKDNRPLPKRVVDRLNLFIESDSYIMHTLTREQEKEENLGIVTRDQRLCYRVKRYLDNKEPTIPHTVWCLDPLIYMIGRTFEVTDLVASWIEDPGAMLHVDYNEFADGMHITLGDDIWEAPIRTFTNRNGIPVALVDQTARSSL
jgi:hypothetical protein